MIRRILMSGSGDGGGSSEPLPPDPTLAEWRSVTRPFGINQNVRGVPAGGETVDFSSITFTEDCNGFTMVFSGVSQGTISDPTLIYVSVKADGWTEWREVLWGGIDHAELTPTTDVESDIVEGVFLENTALDVRVYLPGSQSTNVGNTGFIIAGRDARTEEPFVKTYEFGVNGPWPLVFNGRTREFVKTFGIYGDSISAGAAWFNDAVVTRGFTGVNFGRNVMTYNGRWLTPMSMKGVTHMLVQFGVNDLNGQQPETVVNAMWANAKACYAYIDAFNPGIPIYQTTPTPTVHDTAADNCATLVGQTVDDRGPSRQVWLAWQRDGMPFNLGTGNAVGVGASGVRIGEVGHPVTELVDMAAVTEHGGAGAPSGKWRVDTGALGGDGTHPNDTGVMYDLIDSWLETFV